MAFVLYGGWDGGGVGHGLAVALGFTAGRARWLAPPALLIVGAAMLARPAFPRLRPLGPGGLCLFAAVVLALAAGTLGVSPGQVQGAHIHALHATAAGGLRGAAQWSAAYVEDRGGMAGQALWWATHALVRDLGVTILVAFLLLAALALLSPTALARSAQAASSGLRALWRRLTAAGGTLARPAPEVYAGQVSALAHLREDDLERDDHAPAWGSDGSDGASGSQVDSPGAALQVVGELGRVTPTPSTAAGRSKLTVRSTYVEGPPQDDIAGVDAAAAVAGAGDDGDGSVGGSKKNDGRARARTRAPHPLTQDADNTDEAGVGHGDAAGPAELTPQGRLRGVITDDPDFSWRLPAAAGVLERSGSSAKKGAGKAEREAANAVDASQHERVAGTLVEALGHFGVQAKVIGTVMGPHITRYELRLAPGTKVAKVAALKDDLAYALAATDIRILAPIPGKQAVGVEVPNAHRRIVRLGDVYQEPPRDWSPLTVWLGKDIAGKAIGADLARMPHLLVAGATGSGKSGAINAMLSSVLLRATPHDVRMVLVDPKQVELNHYESIPHLLTPVITNPRKAANALANLVREMEQRYGIMSLARTRSLAELNQARARRNEPPLPHILCVIDELADLMMVAPADVEDSIIRLAQKARAVGIHLVLATQSPRVDVITGMIKANVPSRIAFAVSSQTDSRVILDQNGAEALLGQGDMLFSPMGSSRLQRIQGAYIDESQIAKLTDFWRKQGEPELREELLAEVESEGPSDNSGDDLDPDRDALLADAITLVAEMQTASTSMMQRRLRVGYTRAGRLIDMLERRGVITGYEGSKPRQVLISEADLPRVLASIDDSTEPSTGAARVGPEDPGAETRGPELSIIGAGQSAADDSLDVRAPD
jgi:S-DNA-T family DNA segregation ATPase FtsK/SpoIIIE